VREVGMSVVDAAENRMVDILLGTILPLIGQTTNWNIQVSPNLLEGVPGDAIEVTDTIPSIYVQHAATEPDPTNDAGTRHYWTSTFNLWCAARSVRMCTSLAADIRRALYQSEAAFQTQFSGIMFPGSYSIRDDLATGGVFMGLQVATIAYSTDHSTP
jgi:hypothetical protein